MVNLDDIFDVWYGVNLEVVNSEIIDEGIPFVSRQSVDNGVVCHVQPIEGIEPNPAHTLSIAVSGSVLSTFYHDCEYYSGRDVYIAKPKKPMTREVMIYYAVIIEANKYKYNYGRGANKTFRSIKVPDLSEIPEYVEEYAAEPQFESEPISHSNIKLNVDKWRWFSVEEIFNLQPTKGTTTDELTEGTDIPYIAAKHDNNGCEMMCSKEDNVQFISRGNCIVFICLGAGSAGYALYQGEDFIGMNGKTMCGYNPNLNQYNGLFLAALLSKERPKYSFGRSWTGERLKKTKFKLPVTPEGNPDWQYMEDYIKSQPYTRNLDHSSISELTNKLREANRKLKSLEHQLAAQQPGAINNYGTVNIYEK